MSLISNSQSYQDIIVTDIEILNISIDWKRLFLTIDFEIGSNKFSEIVPLSNSYYLESLETNGVIFHKNIIDVDYTLFITSQELNQNLSGAKFDLDEGILIESSSWFIELQKSFQQYNICFIREIEYDNWRKNSKDYLNSDKIFKGFYHTNPENSAQLQRFMMLNIPSCKSKLIEIHNHYIEFEDFELKILIGDCILESRYCFTYVFQIEDLNKVVPKSLFKKFSHFTFNGKKLPIPNLPITRLNEIKSSEFELYTSYITRSLILCIFISSELSIPLIETNSKDEVVDENELIATSDTYFCDRYNSIYENKDVKIAPYKFLVYPFDIESGDVEFLRQLPDYERLKPEDPSNQPNNYDYFEGEADEYPDYWDDLDTSEKYEDNYELAEQYFAEGEYEYDNLINDYKYKFYENYFYSRRKVFKKLLSNLICPYVDKNFVIFEIPTVGCGFKHKVCPIFINPFVRGISVFSGILSLSISNDIPFCIVQKCPKNTMNEIVTHLMSYKEPYILKFNNCFVCFDIKKYKKLFNTMSNNLPNPTKLYREANPESDLPSIIIK